uniref:Protein Lines N-terminal domain-containing protein n=1 Tax=Meloidogyne floridensis TaxID=298350 RepID=A0A915P5Z8_9BILA
MGSHLFFNENLDGHQTYFPISQQRLLSSHPSIKNKDHSILPHTYSNLEPLRVGSLGDILLTREEYKSEEFDEQDWITLERCLSLASEIRKKMVLLSNFLQQNSDRNYFLQNKCVKPIRDVLQNFIEEITESVQRKRSVFKDPWELFNFLNLFAKQIDPVFLTFQSLLSSMSILTIDDILNFWKCFLQEKINLWDYNNKLVEELFEGFVYLIGKCILEELSSTPEINFLSFLVETDQYLPNMLSFLHRCLILMPKTMSDSLPLFDEIFIEFWENAKMKKCIRYTSTFLSILIRQSLDKFSTKINSIQFYSLNTHALANLFKNSNCVPPFENFSKNSTSNSTSWFIVEEEVKRRLGCLNNTNEDYSNIFYKNQHWSISVFLTPNIYKSLDSIFLRLYKIILAWHTLMNYSNN